MRSIFFGVYAFGAVLSALCMLFLDPALAIAIVMVTPLAAMWAAEQFDLIQFHHIDIDPDDEMISTSVLAQAAREGLTDKQALEKYGQAIINEVNAHIAHVEGQLANMKRNRNEMMRMMQGDEQ